MSSPLFTILIDGLCPLCKREAAFLKRLDAGRNRLAFIDIAAPDFDPSALNLTMIDVMGTIHGLRPDGSIVRGVEVFRLAYAAVGYGWLLAPTGWPILKPIFDALYRVFARLRLRLSSLTCDTGRCAINPTARS